MRLDTPTTMQVCVYTRMQRPRGSARPLHWGVVRLTPLLISEEAWQGKPEGEQENKENKGHPAVGFVRFVRLFAVCTHG